MSPERWRQIEELYHAALERDPERRARFLAEACQGDEELRREVESLLSQEGVSLPELGMRDVLAPATLPGSYRTDDLMIGQTISHYRITGQLGSGGMGVVYKAEDTNLDRIVALKFLAVHLLESEEHKQRFLREAKAGASIDHPNICTVYEVGEADGHIFLAMSYIDGPEVRAKIKERPLKLDEALDIAIHAAEGLRAAHQKGVVHRDIQSSNVMLTSTGQVKIMDFGLAQLTGGTRLTTTKTILGTPAYMSPEQAQRLETDRRTDIWSLGVVLYEMVTGRLPFEGDREPAVVHSIINEPHEPITAIRAGVPLELDRIVGKALAKNPTQRYQHLDDMLVDLRALRGHVHGGRPATGTTSRSRWLWVALIPKRLTISGILVILVAVAAWLLYTREKPAEVVVVPLTTYVGLERSPSFSPDASQVAFVWNGEREDNFDIYVKLIRSGSPLRLTTDPAPDGSPQWSPDGQSIAFVRMRKDGRLSLRTIPALGGAERELAVISEREEELEPQISWWPDSQWLAIVDTPSPEAPPAIFALSIGTGERRQLTFPPRDIHGDRMPAVSLDGKWLAFTRCLSASMRNLYVMPLKGIRPAPAQGLTSTNQLLTSPAWSGADLVFSYGFTVHEGRGLWRVRVPNGIPERISQASDNVTEVAARLGRIAFTRLIIERDIRRVQLDRADPKPERFLFSTRQETHAAYSPDGRRLAFVSTRSGTPEIWVCDADCSNPVQVTHFGGPLVGFFSWSPNGYDLAFHARPLRQAEIFVVNVESGPARQMTYNPADDSTPTFSRDGKFIYFRSRRSGESQIWRMPASGGSATQITKNGGYIGYESVDRRTLYFSKFGASTLWRMDINGGIERLLVSGASNTAFAVTGSALYFFSTRDARRPTLTALNLSTGESRPIVSVERPIGMDLSISPDEKYAIYVQVERTESDLMLVENFR